MSHIGFKQIHCSWKCKRKSISIQVMISNSLFEETNKPRIFSKVFYNYVLNFWNIIFHWKWKILQWKISPYRKFTIIRRKKWKYYDFACAINCAHKLTYVCACTCACDQTHLRKQCARLIFNNLTKQKQIFKKIHPTGFVYFSSSMGSIKTFT